MVFRYVQSHFSSIFFAMVVYLLIEEGNVIGAIMAKFKMAAKVPSWNIVQFWLFVSFQACFIVLVLHCSEQITVYKCIPQVIFLTNLTNSKKATINFSYPSITVHISQIIVHVPFRWFNELLVSLLQEALLRYPQITYMSNNFGPL